MEKRYEISLEVGGHRREQEREIKRVCMVEWAFRDEDFTHERSESDRRKLLLKASAIGSVFEGEDISELVARIERAVWRANGGMCHVAVKVAEFSKIDGKPVLTECCEDEERMIA